MTKKDYEVIAAVLVSESQSVRPGDHMRLVDKFCETFARDNPHFKKELFERACGVYSCEICKKREQSFRTTSLADSKTHFLHHLNNES